MNYKYAKIIALSALGTGTSAAIHAQGWGNFSGDLMSNINFFRRDEKIGADNTMYNNVLSGGESWLTMRYSNYGFTGFVRVDVFNNSNLKYPTQPISGFGLGAWSLNKNYKGLDITGGYIYDQIGTGFLFRAYEDRGLNIDNALEGLRVKYQLTDNVSLKAFTGQQKNIFSRYNPIIKGFAADGNFSIKDKVFLNPGIGVLNRTLDNASMADVITRVNALPVEQRFMPKYNMYAGAAYNTLTVGNFSWYAEAAVKSKEAFNDYNGNIQYGIGSAVYSTMSYAQKGIALNLTGKRTKNFVMRTSPSQTSNDGMLNWQAIVAQIRPQRLIARYMPQSLDWSELAFNGTLLLTPSDNYDFNFSYTHINTLEKEKLYREIYGEDNIRSIPNSILQLGVHYMEYNQAYYQFKPGVPLLKALTPFAELTYRLSPKQSLDIQAQYMNNK